VDGQQFPQRRFAHDICEARFAYCTFLFHSYARPNFNLLRRPFVQIGPILKFNGLSVITNDVVEASEYPRDRRHIALEKDRHLPSEVTGLHD